MLFCLLLIQQLKKLSGLNYQQIIVTKGKFVQVGGDFWDDFFLPVVVALEVFWLSGWDIDGVMEHLLGDVTLGEGGCLFEVVFCVDDFVGDLVKVLGGNDEGRPVLDEVDEVDYLFRHLCSRIEI